jgi:hypothetical protein
MFFDFVYSVAISIAGAILFLLADRYEHSHIMAATLKFWVVFVSSVIVMERLGPYLLPLF